MLIKNVSNRLWTLAGQQLVPGADAVEVACTEADIKGNADLEMVRPKIGRPPAQVVAKEE